jgi:YD repeat-containing protein
MDCRATCCWRFRRNEFNFPSSLSENCQYNADNNLTSKTDRMSQTVTYLNGALNRLTSKIYPDSTAVEYVYDLVGKIQHVNDPTGTYAFAGSASNSLRRFRSNEGELNSLRPEPVEQRGKPRPSVGQAFANDRGSHVLVGLG